MTDTGANADPPSLPTTSWAVLGLLSFGWELSGYELKKWADWSLRFFYWSPSFSQIYGELKRLERLGYARSRPVSQDGVRGKWVYTITPSGMSAVARWVDETPVEPPVLKHSVMLRVWLGHLSDPDKLRELLEQHREYAERMRVRAEADAEGASEELAWVYPEAVLRWAVRYYEAERDLAGALLEDVERLARARRPPAGPPGTSASPRRSPTHEDPARRDDDTGKS